MLISHRKEFIYTKTAKSAGTSVKVYFEQYCMPEGEWMFSHGREEHVSATGIIGYRGTSAKGKQWRNHMSAAEISDRIGASIWNGFKFCVIRNPFDKLVSAFFFLNKDYEDEDLINNFRNWIKRGGSVIDRDEYLIGGEICVDYFIIRKSLAWH